LSTSLKGPFGMLIAGLALSLASFLAALVPSVAEAQDTGGASTQKEEWAQQQNTNAPGGTSDAPAPPRRQADESPATLVVEPGDSLWSIAQQRLGAGATPGQIAEEVDRLHALNRGRMGEDPNLLLAGQELLVAAPDALVPASPLPVSPEPNTDGPTTATDPIAEISQAQPFTLEPTTTATAPAVVPEEREQQPSAVEPAADDQRHNSAADEQPVVDEAPVVNQAPAEGRSAGPSPDPEKAAEPGAFSQGSPEQEEAAPGGALRELDGATARRLLGFGIVALSLVVAILGVWRLSRRRPVEDPGAPSEAPPTLATHNGSSNGANGRGDPRGPAVAASAGHLAATRSRPLSHKPYVDRTGMAVLRRPNQREAPRRRAHSKTTFFSPKKRRHNGAQDQKVRLLLKGASGDGARGLVRAQYRMEGGDR
jgi:hypothetical protein